METQLVKDISEKDGVIVSCGGGAVLREENVSFMKENGRIVLLSATPETIYERVRYSKDRPILNGHMNVEYIRELMENAAAVMKVLQTLRWQQTAGVQRQSQMRLLQS